MDGRQMMNNELKKRFHGKEMVQSKYIPHFPDSAMRDYIRLANELSVDAMREPLKQLLPELIQIIKDGEKSGSSNYNTSTIKADGKQSRDNEREREKSRRETLAATATALDDWFEKLREAIKNSMKLFRVRDKLNAIASANRKLTVKEWRKAVNKTLGINILEDYYDGNFYEEILEKWISDNVDLISTIPSEFLDDMKKIVLDGYLNGKTVSKIAKEIQHTYGTTKSHARLIAKDQTGKLNAKITQYQQQSCGVNKYKWRTAGDGRVRDDHKDLNGKIFDWDHPPVVDQKKGRRAHPGEDYNCRCVAIPVFDFDELDLPVDGTAGKERRPGSEA